MTVPSFFRSSLSLVVAAAVATGCASSPAARRYTRDQAESGLKKLEVISLSLGDFAIDGAASVVDGDTIRVKGLDSSLRLLAIDTEETFKHEAERQAFSEGWESYKKEMRGDSSRPVKMATPVGEDAKHFAQAFFEGVQTVRLERDHPGEIRDYYGRYLAYVFVRKNGEWKNYALECIRAGMSPYFTKYGRSRRFHQDFVEAQRQAQQAKLGIWNPDKQHYGDYAERIAWWDQRAAMIARFEKDAEGSKDHVVLTRWDALLRLEQRLGQPVVVLGAVSEVRMGDRGPTVVKLSRTRGNDFDVVFFDKEVALSSGILQSRGEYVQVRGVVDKRLDRRRNAERLQLVVSLPGQVVAPNDELEALLEAGAPTDANKHAQTNEEPD
jgi:endonuclease YncB( thermonuclease family)